MFQRSPSFWCPLSSASPTTTWRTRIRRPRARPDPVGAGRRHRRRGGRLGRHQDRRRAGADSASSLVADKVLPPTEKWIRSSPRTSRRRRCHRRAQRRLPGQHVPGPRHPSRAAPHLDDDPHVGLASHALLATRTNRRLPERSGNPKTPLRKSLEKAVAALWVDPVPASRIATGGSVIATRRRGVELGARVHPARVLQPDRSRPHRRAQRRTNGTDADVITRSKTRSAILRDRRSGGARQGRRRRGPSSSSWARLGRATSSTRSRRVSAAHLRDGGRPTRASGSAVVGSGTALYPLLSEAGEGGGAVPQPAPGIRHG